MRRDALKRQDVRVEDLPVIEATPVTFLDQADGLKKVRQAARFDGGQIKWLYRSRGQIMLQLGNQVLQSGSAFPRLGPSQGPIPQRDPGHAYDVCS